MSFIVSQVSELSLLSRSPEGLRIQMTENEVSVKNIPVSKGKGQALIIFVESTLYILSLCERIKYHFIRMYKVSLFNSSLFSYLFLSLTT